MVQRSNPHHQGWQGQRSAKVGKNDIRDVGIIADFLIFDDFAGFADSAAFADVANSADFAETLNIVNNASQAR